MKPWAQQAFGNTRLTDSGLYKLCWPRVPGSPSKLRASYILSATEELLPLDSYAKTSANERTSNYL